MKRRWTQAEVDKFREEYEKWDKFGRGSETADELARRIGTSKATLYRLREKDWRVDGAGTNVAFDRGEQDEAQVRGLLVQLMEAYRRIGKLEQQLAGPETNP